MITGNTNGHHIYMKQKKGDRGQDTGETERGRVAARWGSISCKNDHWRNGPFGIRIGLK